MPEETPEEWLARMRSISVVSKRPADSRSKDVRDPETGKLMKVTKDEATRKGNLVIEKSIDRQDVLVRPDKLDYKFGQARVN